MYYEKSLKEKILSGVRGIVMLMMSLTPLTGASYYVSDEDERIQVFAKFAGFLLIWILFMVVSYLLKQKSLLTYGIIMWAFIGIVFLLSLMMINSNFDFVKSDPWWEYLIVFLTTFFILPFSWFSSAVEMQFGNMYLYFWITPILCILFILSFRHLRKKLTPDAVKEHPDEHTLSHSR